MSRTYLLIAAIAAGLAVALGAFGAHSLKNILTPEKLATFQTAVSYHFYHALGLLAISILLHLFAGERRLIISARFLCGGIILFSGSLYLYVLIGWRWLPMLTPFGGLCFIIGWIFLAGFALKMPRKNNAT